ncbi:MAG: 4-alpha-glucanotransferase [Actinomycetota bacterium]|jgi:4-alpha-glucanotransferase|nr:4-alpha-glucanotransferase [Actinomycetota bacterium]
MDAGAWGIEEGYWDALGRWNDVPPASLDAIARSMGASDDQPVPPESRPLWCVRAGHVEFLRSPADLVLEEGTVLRDVDALPPDLPLGYHELRPSDGGPPTLLVVSPGRCHLPPDLRTWGWAVQLYATRSRESWGIGDLGDLRRLAEWAGREGAGLLTVSPLHAPGPAFPQQPSPYYPSSRRFRNPLHIRVEEAPGAADAGADLDRLAKLGRALNADPHIDRDAVWRIKRDALEVAFGRFKGDAGLDAWLTDQGDSLLEFATYCAIADEHGNTWSDWPAALRRPDSPAVAAYAEAHADTVGFHAWLQWVLDVQLESVSAVPLVHDLAVGFDPGGADAWAWQDLLADGMRVGAPPDEFNRSGQDWGLPPFVPWKLRAEGYRPFIETLRSAFRHAGGLRVDHVMGLFRLFWIPTDAEAAGTYVRYPSADLLDIVALESHRAHAIVVGEDLGTVEDSVRHELWERQVLSYRLLWFEPNEPAQWPERALGAITTHDLPTVAGVWTGSDHQAGAMRDRLRERAAVDDDDDVDVVVRQAYRALGHAASAVVVGTLDDALDVTERPNLPGTVDEGNWSRALPLALDEIETDPRVLAVGDALQESR